MEIRALSSGRTKEEVAEEIMSAYLFGHLEKQTTEDVAEAFRERLKKVAGFAYVPEPIPMRNTTGATVYYLFFAAHLELADGIVTQIFNKYRTVGSMNV